MSSWAISLALFTLFGISIWMILGEPDHNLLDAFPPVISTLFGIWGLYTGIGAMALWITMWVYWATVERRSAQTRAVWFVALLFGMYYGALIYALILWRGGAIRRRRLDTVSVTSPDPDEGATGASQLGTGDDNTTTGA
jgi:hypothetical protein